MKRFVLALALLAIVAPASATLTYTNTIYKQWGQQNWWTLCQTSYDPFNAPYMYSKISYAWAGISG